MIGAALTRIFGTPPDPGAPSRLPAELALAIAGADVIFRPSVAADGAPRITIRLQTVGAFAYDGTGPTADRIGAAWPELSRQQATHAAGLVAAQVGAMNRLHVLARAPRRRGWALRGLEDAL